MEVITHPRLAEDLNPDWLPRLRQAGRATIARRLAMQVLLDRANEHLTIAELHARICQRGASIDLSTVYRTMEWLTEAGLAHRLDVLGDARYGPNEHAHHHAVCTYCGRVIEIAPADVIHALADLFQTTGIRPDEGSGLTLRGTCPSCLGQTDGQGK